MNEKGQALVEFILILPVMLLVVVVLIDIGNIFMQKINLNDSLQTVCELYKNDNEKELLAYTAKENLQYDEKSVNDMVKITLKKNVDVTAPILSNVLGKKYTMEASKTIYAGDNDETE